MARAVVLTGPNENGVGVPNTSQTRWNGPKVESLGSKRFPSQEKATDSSIQMAMRSPKFRMKNTDPAKRARLRTKTCESEEGRVQPDGVSRHSFRAISHRRRPALLAEVRRTRRPHHVHLAVVGVSELGLEELLELRRGGHPFARLASSRIFCRRLDRTFRATRFPFAFAFLPGSLFLQRRQSTCRRRGVWSFNCRTHSRFCPGGSHEQVRLP